MDLINKYLGEAKKKKDSVKTLAQYSGKGYERYVKKKAEGKGLPTLKFLKSIFGDDIIKNMKKGIDYE
jgi:tetrahydromethanopterin S-methyltransferase subunit D